MFELSFKKFIFNDSHRLLSIEYLGTGNPETISNLTTYEYSVNGGPWLSMSLGDGTETTNLDFTPLGNNLLFVWKIKEDIDDGIYNKNIYIRFQASYNTIKTNIKYYFLYFPKSISDETDQNFSNFPIDYQGIPGYDLLKKAPRINK